MDIKSVIVRKVVGLGTKYGIEAPGGLIAVTLKSKYIFRFV